MKKIRSLVIMLGVTLLLTGCVKYNVNMDIKKDKSMNLNITYALDTTYFGEESAFSKEQIKKLEDQGYTVSEYSEGTMKGYTITMKVDNIDDLSSTDATEYSFTGLGNNDSKKMFKVKKGFFKNKYTAKFSFDASESGLKNNNTLNSGVTDDEDEITLNTDEETQSTDTEESEDLELTDIDDTLDSNEDYSQMMKYMDLSFSVTLPYKAISSNATSVNNDGKELVWDLSSNSETNSIEFEFELYRFSAGPIITIVIAVIGGLFIIALIVTVIMAISGGKKPKKEEPSKETQA